MKTLIACILLFAGTAGAATIATNVFDLQSVASTTALGYTNTVSGVSAPTRQFIIQHGALGSVNTNDLRIAAQFSFDNQTWTTIGTFKPANTNAAVEIWNPSFQSLTCYMRLEIETSNTITVGVISTRAQ